MKKENEFIEQSPLLCTCQMRLNYCGNIFSLTGGMYTCTLNTSTLSIICLR